MPKAWAMPSVILWRSASPELNDMVVWVLAYCLTKQPPIISAPPMVDFRGSLKPAKSASIEMSAAAGSSHHLYCKTTSWHSEQISGQAMGELNQFMFGVENVLHGSSEADLWRDDLERGKCTWLTMPCTLSRLRATV